MHYDLETPEGLAHATRWLRRLLSTLQDEAVWFVPRSHSQYRLYKKRKLAIKETGTEEPSVQHVFEAIGWTVR